jgi:membrane-associated phospholipid phosphatase
MNTPFRLVSIHTFLAISICGAGVPCQARDSVASRTLEDAKLYVTAPVRWDASDWMWFGGSLVAITAAHEYDDNVRSHFGVVVDPAQGKADPHDSRDWAPAAAIVGLTWAYATLIDNRDGYTEGRAMLESAAFSAVSGTALKLAAGRRRPTETLSSDAWRNGGSSFPSMHATVTFAVGTVLAESGNEDYRWTRRFLGYGLAAGTAYSRVHDGVHWLSDTVAGAALGMATGRFVLHRDPQRRQHYSLDIVPIDRGAMLTCRVDLSQL